jgi:hydroxymethylglutaryl-CoA reductase (NADPH)
MGKPSDSRTAPVTAHIPTIEFPRTHEATASGRQAAAIDPLPRAADPAGVRARWRRAGAPESARAEIADPRSVEREAVYRRNIENYIGTLTVPVGLVGPLVVHGRFADGDYLVPLATTEATLVASYHRGAKLLALSGGCRARTLAHGVGRAPGFVFGSMDDAACFAEWVATQAGGIRSAAERTSRHARLLRMRCIPEGRYAFLVLEFATGDASGQNMVTIAAEAACDFIRRTSPYRPQAVYVESNFSGDKKASAQVLQSVRGRKVSAEAIVPDGYLRQVLHTTAEEMARYYRMAAVAVSLSGSLGTQGHFANGLAALYLACGQDVACVAESALGHTLLERMPGGDLLCSVTLPGLMVATVGGGTGLPGPSACLGLLGLRGEGGADRLAEVAAALCLAGELSIIGAICAGEFTQAHRRMARGQETA